MIVIIAVYTDNYMLQTNVKDEGRHVFAFVGCFVHCL
jgi:hypothetical protein